MIALAARPASAQTLAATYLGGAREDSARDVAYDGAGNLYAVGGTGSADFVTTDGSRLDPGATGASFGAHDVWIAKIAPDGALLWVRLLGGPSYDRAYAVEVNDTGVYIAGRAGAGFPTTAGALQRSFAGDSDVNPGYGAQDGFVARLSTDGELEWSTYLGGPGREFVRDIAIDSSGAVYAACTALTTIPHVTAGSFRSSASGGYDGAVIKLAPAGDRVVWGTYLGGSGDDLGNPAIRVDAAGNAYVLGFGDSADFPTVAAYRSTRSGGNDLTLTGIRGDGAALIFSTYLGGSGDEELETHGLAIHGDVLAVAGYTTSTDLATTAGVVQRAYGGGGGDAMVSVLRTDGTHDATTYLGGSGRDESEGVDVLSDGRIVLTGTTASSDFPSTDASWEGAARDGHLTVLTGDLGAVSFAARIGGGGDDATRNVAVAPGSDRIGFGGVSASSDFPVTDGSRYRSTGAFPHDRDAIVGWLALPAGVGDVDAGPGTAIDGGGGPGAEGDVGVRPGGDGSIEPTADGGLARDGATVSGDGGPVLDAAGGGHVPGGCACRAGRGADGGASGASIALLVIAGALARRRRTGRGDDGTRPDARRPR
jgi:hypothetical protein